MSGRKSEVELILRCVFCGYDTRLVVKLASTRSMTGKSIQVVRYCEHCNRPNKLEVRDTIDVHPLILGQDAGVVSYHNNIPVIQGEKVL